MKKYLWIGSFISDEISENVSQLGYHNSASKLSQKNILQGIEHLTGLAFDSIGCLSMVGYPKQGKLFVDDIRFSHQKGANDQLVGFFNLYYINKLSGQRRLTQTIKEWAVKHKEDEVDIFVYEMRSQCLMAAEACKDIIKTVRIHLIVPDLPQFMDLGMSPLKKILKQIDWKTIQKRLSIVDDYILYSESMAKFLNLSNQRWMVMEGSISSDEIEEICSADSDDSSKTIILYSGSIQLGFGIKNLLDAMSYLDDSFELWLTGDGSAVDIVKGYAKKDKRITYYGFLPTREELKKIQAKATMMINMRDPESPASKYCFPSKIFEYMLSGKPVLSPRMEGIPKEYYKYLIEIISLKPRDIADAITKCSLLPNKEQFGLDGRNFIIRNKTNEKQSERILNFLGEIT